MAQPTSISSRYHVIDWHESGFDPRQLPPDSDISSKAGFLETINSMARVGWKFHSGITLYSRERYAGDRGELTIKCIFERMDG